MERVLQTHGKGSYEIIIPAKYIKNAKWKKGDKIEFIEITINRVSCILLRKKDERKTVECIKELEKFLGLRK